MEPEKAIEQIEAILGVIGVETELFKIHKIANRLFCLIEILERVDQKTTVALKEKTLEIISAGDVASVKSNIDEIKPLLLILKNKLKQFPVEKTFLGAPNKIYLETYFKARQRYRSYTKQIDKLEQRILSSFQFEKKLHEPIKHGKYKECCHARLTDNLRIIYFIRKESDVAVFVTIITHNELEKS